MKSFYKFVSVFLCIMITAAFSPNAAFTAFPTALSVSAEDEPYTVIVQQEDINRDEDLSVQAAPELPFMYSFPDYMKGVFVTPGEDFALTDEEGNPLSDADIDSNVSVLLDRVTEQGLNTLIVATSAEDVFYSTDVNDTVEKSVIEYIITPAKERGLFVYLDFEIDTLLDSLAETSIEDRINKFAIDVRNFTFKYPCDGIILDGYYASRNTETLTDYMTGGSGIGYNNWLSENNAYIFSLAAAAVHKTDNTIPVGIALTDVWSNYKEISDSETVTDNVTENSTENNTDSNTEDEADGSSNSIIGSETAADFEALSDGYADTLSYIQSGYADFMLVNTDGAIGDDVVPFKTITQWWNDKAVAAGIPMYVGHANEKICTDNTGWYSPDELVKQVIAAKELAGCKGSAFNDLYALEVNQGASTTALQNFYDETLDVEGLDSELEMTLPTSRDYKTEEPTAIFAGSFDPNFPVYFQGKEIVLNEAGRFYFTVDLEVGVNTFKVQSKAKAITYRITRTVQILQKGTMIPADGPLYVDGETTLLIGVIAYRGSDVSATVNGKNLTLKETDGQSEGIDPNSYYTRFAAYYTVPKGKIGEEIDLGNVIMTGYYTSANGTTFKQSFTGAQIVVNPIPEQMQAFDGSLLMINSNNTMTYQSNTTDTSPTPDSARLPAGTLDYFVRSVTLSGTEYYVTNSGRRIRANAVTVLPNEPLGMNPIGIQSAGTTGTDTFINFSLSRKIPYSIVYNGSDYTAGDNGKYYVKNFNASSVSIIFDYITSVSVGDINFPATSQFTTGKFDTYESNGLKKTRLTLFLRESGVYCGMSGTYDDAGNLRLLFNGSENSIAGATIVIDPGHGYTGKSEFDPGAIGHIKEQSANYSISYYLEQYLINAGANVIRLKTESETYVTEERASISRQYKPDMFISVHCNSAGKTAFGTEAYYFTPFSEPLARYVSANIADVLDDVHGGGDNDRGAKYNYFFVTQQQEFPSILVETAFVTNYAEAMSLAETDYQKRYAKAIMNGIEQYFNRTTYNSYGDGYAQY
jgi:N-acetylmuramoyl-L-alanine amidase